MILHMLPGDAIAEAFAETKIEGERAVCRECLVDGPVDAENLHELWTKREMYLGAEHPEQDISYAQNVAAELGKLIELPAGAEVNLWFEYELFCQVNMWFCLYLLRDTAAEVFRVAPSVRTADDVWKGFGQLGAAELEKCFEQRIRLDEDDIRLGAELWLAFQAGDDDKLLELAAEATSFPYLREVCEAAIARHQRPKEILSGIVSGGRSDFSEIFAEFSKQAGVYGYGDTQVRRLLSSL